MEIIYANSENFDELVSKGLVLIDFYADWCGPCRALTPVLEELASDRSELKIVKINVDKDPVLAQKYDVMSIPNLVLLSDSKVLGTKVGFIPKEGLIEWIEQSK